jgi:hypothetical protein
MRQTIEEAEAAKEDFRIPCCGNRTNKKKAMEEKNENNENEICLL